MSHSRPTPAPLFLGALALTAAAASLFASLAFAAPGDAKKPPTSAPHAKPAATLSEDEKIVHVLNRLGYGPRPGDVERVKAMGLSRYIDLQLNPDRVPDTALDTKLAAFTTLNMSAEQLATEYHALVQSSKEEQALRRQMRKQAGGANGGAAQQAGGANNAAQPAAGADTTPAGGAGDAQAPAGGAKKRAKRPQGMTPDARREARQARQMMSQTATPIAQAHAEFMAAKALRAIESERQLQEVLVDFWGNHFNIDIRKQPCGVLKILDDRDTIRPHIFGKFRDLLGASAKSPAMLVYLDNYQSMSATAPAGPAGRNRANRARRLQRLGITDATAQTPAMPPNRARRLQRLGPANPAAQTAAVPPKAKKRRPTGLNENYAREIMELHTLGVDGGYTQKDVTEVARCLTGWSVSADGRRPGMGKYAEAGAFHFYPAMHDNGEKTVLGHVIPAGGGEKDGEMVLDILASHPATMRHVSEQLCQRLVADQPPASLVDKCVATWKRTDGDLREIVRTIVTSPEFYAPSARRSKIKSPFEYAVSSVRALGGTYQAAAAERAVAKPQRAIALLKPPKGGGYLDLNISTIVGQVGTMGEPLFQYQAPTGYPEDSQKWVSSGALISRLNFALALTSGKIADVALDRAGGATGDPAHQIDRIAAQVLHAPISPATRATLLKQVQLVSTDSGQQANSAGRIEALLLGSPEFQRR